VIRRNSDILFNSSSVLHPQRSSVCLRAPAKINWFLRIIAQRKDGYHDIQSLMQCVALYDIIKCRQADSLKVVCDMDMPMEDNLVYKAASILKSYASCRNGAIIEIEKNIPAGAGLGGGSSDAAAALAGLNLLWGLNLNNSELSTVANEIGSDVPFFLNGPFALVEGRGDRIFPLKTSSSAVLLLVKPQQSVSTAWAYATFDSENMPGMGKRTSGSAKQGKLTKKPIDIKLFCQALDGQNTDILRTMLVNDLEEVVSGQFPAVREIRNKLKETGASLSAMSGSGTTVFGVFRNRQMAEKSAEAMKPHSCWVVETLT
jgi:4-diphosphocytidyl-2-C-methyl-D-erythritol kinase